VLEDGVAAAEPQVGVLLPGEAGVRQVLRRRRRSDGDRHLVREAGLQGVVGAEDLRPQVLGHLARHDLPADPLRRLVDRGDVGAVQAGELGGDHVREPGPVDDLVEVGGRDGEPGRDRHAGRRHGDQRGALAAEEIVLRLGTAVEELDEAGVLHVRPPR
jgi:hypothetical protein